MTGKQCSLKFEFGSRVALTVETFAHNGLKVFEAYLYEIRAFDVQSCHHSRKTSLKLQMIEDKTCQLFTANLNMFSHHMSTLR